MASLITLNLIQMAFFYGLNWNTNSLQGDSSSQKILDGYFQSIATRTAGFNTIDLGSASPAYWVILIAMMYIAAYPVVVALRSTNGIILSFVHDRGVFD